METETTETTQTEAAAKAATTPKGAPTEQVQVAKEALKLFPAEEKSDADGKMEGTSKKLVGDITAQRALRRQLTAENKALAQQRETLLAPVEKASEQSPLEKFVAENPEDPVPSRVTLAERDFQSKRKASETKKKDKKSAKAASEKRGDDASARALAKYPDFFEVGEQAEELLTDGDRLDIQKAEFPEDLIYKKAIQRILEAGGNAAKELRARLSKTVESESAPTEKEDKKGGSEEKKPLKTKNVQLAKMRKMLG